MSYSRYRSLVNETGIIGTQGSNSLCEVSDSGGFFLASKKFPLVQAVSGERIAVIKISAQNIHYTLYAQNNISVTRVAEKVPPLIAPNRVVYTKPSKVVKTNQNKKTLGTDPALAGDCRHNKKNAINSNSKMTKLPHPVYHHLPIRQGDEGGVFLLASRSLQPHDGESNL